MNQPSDLTLIIELFPECPRVEQLPTIDAIVCEYLRQHDVNITPVSSDVQPSRMTNAAMGAMGAGYLAANTHLTVQQNAVALQEWTTWKQWALSQPDFKDFKRRILERANAAQERQDQWIEENRGRIQAALVERRAEIHKNQMFTMKLFAGGIGLIIVLSGVTAIVDQFKQPSAMPASAQQR